MAQLVIAAAGAAIGGALAGPGAILLGLSGAQIGWMAGGILGGMLAGGQKSAGPRLDELRVSGTEYGSGIPWLAGAPRVAGDLIWASDRRETAKTEEVGKGGGSEYTSYTYDVDALYLLADNQLQGVTRIFVDGKLVWTLRPEAGSASLASSDQTTKWRRITFYSGSQDQLPDPTYDAAVANAPGYTGRATIFFEGLQLGQSGALPNITFEACASASVGGTSLNTELARVLSATTPDNELYGLAVFADPDTGSVQFYIAGSGTTARTVTVSAGGAVTLGGYFTYNRGDIRSLGETDQLASLAYRATGPQPYNYTLHTGTSGGAGTVISVPAATNTFSTAPVWALREGILYVAAQASGGISVKTIYRFSGGSAAGSYTAPNWVQSLAAGTDFLYGLEDWGSTGAASTDRIFKIDATTMALVGTIQSPYYPTPQASGRLLVNQANELFYVRGTGTSTNAWWKYVAGAWVLVSSDLGNANPGNVSGGFQSQTAVINNTLYVVKFAAGTHEFVVYRSNATLSPGTETLRSVVERLCDRAGMPAGTYDASALASITQPVRALAVSGGNVRQALEILRTSHGFDAFVSDKLYFVPRGGAPAVTISAEDLGTAEGDASEEAFSPTINADLEIPGRVAVVYRNMDADQVTGTEQSDRGPTAQDSLQTMQLAIGMKPAEAKGVADAIVRDAFAARIVASISLPMGYTKVTPTDVVQVPDTDGTLYRMRVTRRSDSGGVMTLDLVGDDGTVVPTQMPTDISAVSQSAVIAVGDTDLYPLDVPLLRDADDGVGYYVAVRGNSTLWPGCIVQSSSDGVAYTTVAQASENAVFGVATSVLGAWTGGCVMDERNTLTVNVGTGELSSVTRDALLAGRKVNALMVGEEIIRFCTASLVSANPNIYTLSRLLRGQRGTEWAMGLHVANERVALLTERGLRRVTQSQWEIGKGRSLRAVTIGKQVADATVSAFTNYGRSSRPPAPVNIRATCQINGDIVFTWSRRSRYETQFTGVTGAVVPLGESSEAYQCDVFASSAYDIPVLSFPVTKASATYTIEAQTSVTQSPFTLGKFFVRVQQIGGLSGFEGRAEIPIPVFDPSSAPVGSQAGQPRIRAFFWYDLATSTSSFAYSVAEYGGYGSGASEVYGTTTQAPADRVAVNIKPFDLLPMGQVYRFGDAMSAVTLSAGIYLYSIAYDAATDNFFALANLGGGGGYSEYVISAAGTVVSVTPATITGTLFNGQFFRPLLIKYLGAWRAFEAGSGFARYMVRSAGSATWTVASDDLQVIRGFQNYASVQGAAVLNVSGADVLFVLVHTYSGSAGTQVRYASILRSSDGVTFSPVATVLERGSAYLGGPSGALAANLLNVVGGKLTYYYEDVGGKTAWQSSTDGLTWSKLPVLFSGTPAGSAGQRFIACAAGVVCHHIEEAGYVTSKATLMASTDGVSFTPVSDADTWTSGYANAAGDYVPVAGSIFSDLRAPLVASGSRVLFERALIQS